jgi:thioesterase domain-containing protein
MVDQSASDIAQALTSMWQRVLSCKSVQPDDDFFDLGGNTFLAFKLSMEIEDKLHRTLPAATICAAPTIAALSSLLRTPSTPAPLVMLKPGTEGPPIFMCPGIGGSVIDLVPLARRMQSNRPFYGMELPGGYGVENLPDRIEDMADFFLAAIRQLQPRGPYFLIGYSLGGLVTLEIAQRMRMADENAALLAMIDSYPDRSQLSFIQRAGLAPRLAWLRLARGMQKKAPIPPGGSNPALAKEKYSVTMERSKEAQYRALRNYRPRFYEGKVNFIRAAVPTYFPSDPAPVWRRWVKELEIETVSGDHVGMITTHIDDLAPVLTRWVRQALGST